MSKRLVSDAEDPQNVSADIVLPAKRAKVLHPGTSKKPLSRGKDVKYHTESTPLTYKQKTNIKTNPQSPLARMKPLVPNLLDQLAVESVYRASAIRRMSGRQWAVVQEQ
jgi:hypothetical protein